MAREDWENGLDESCEVGGGIKVVLSGEEDSASGRGMGAPEEGVEGDKEIGKAWSFFLLYLFGCPAILDCKDEMGKGLEWMEVPVAGGLLDKLNADSSKLVDVNEKLTGAPILAIYCKRYIELPLVTPHRRSSLPSLLLSSLPSL